MEGVLAITAIWMVTSVALWSRSRSGWADSLPENVPGSVSCVLSPAEFCRKVFVWAFLVRLLLVFVINFTDAIRKLHLSPDSLKYHRVGVEIAEQMRRGDFNWPNWIDNGWYQFTGFVYYLLGPHPVILQLVNITFAAVTPILVYSFARKVYDDECIARWSALFTAFLPSFIYWSCLMLKDSASTFAVSLMVLSVVSLRQRFQVRWLASLAAALAIIIGVREYLFFVALLLIPVSFLPVGGRMFSVSIAKLAVLTFILGFAASSVGFGFLGLDEISTSMYFDLDYINYTRIAMGDHGSGAFFRDPGQFQWGGELVTNVVAALVAVFYFFISLDLRELDSVRQWMALPEVLLFLALIPYMFRGMLEAWRNHRNEAVPLFVFSLSIMVVYGAATTNMGAMFRWRMQSMPIFLSFVSCGLVFTRRGWATRWMENLTRKWM